ncbi:Uncharacterised protein [Escherichia coli]|uniref:Uncharacterized protein n=1 Tax=Escherichia coli TaxID=562 RepID=A0A376VR53_ECOLX|nr:Uncharacterised protein [Escherichia coli]
MTPESVMMMGTEAMKVALALAAPAIVGSVGHGPYHQYFAGRHPD